MSWLPRVEIEESGELTVELYKDIHKARRSCLKAIFEAPEGTLLPKTAVADLMVLAFRRRYGYWENWRWVDRGCVLVRRYFLRACSRISRLLEDREFHPALLRVTAVEPTPTFNATRFCDISHKLRLAAYKVL